VVGVDVEAVGCGWLGSDAGGCGCLIWLCGFLVGCVAFRKRFSLSVSKSLVYGPCPVVCMCIIFLAAPVGVRVTTALIS